MLAADRRLRAAGALVHRGTFPRHRQGTRWRPFAAGIEGRAAVLPPARPRRGGHAPGDVVGRGASADVADRAKAGHQRSRGHRCLRRQDQDRAAPGRALPPHGRGHPRHEPESVERLEGEAARGSVPRHAVAAYRPRCDAQARRQPRSAPQRGGPAAAALRRPRYRRAGAMAQARQRVLPAPQCRRDRVACAPTLLPRRREGTAGQSAAVARRRRAAGDDLFAGSEGAVRAHLQLLR